MEQYEQCEHCDKIFTCKQNLKYHLENKKYKCYEKKSTKYKYKYSYACEYCPKKFSRKQYLANHINKQHSEILIKKQMEDMKSSFIEHISLLKSELKDAIENNPKSIINNTTNNNTINNINNGNIIQNPQIYVKAYSQDNDSYITDDVLDGCVKNPYEGILILTKMINFNDNHPENFNIYLKNKKSKDICFFDNKKWVSRDKKSALNYIFNTQSDRIGEYMDAHPEKFKHEKGFVDNILYVIMDISTHDTKMRTDKHYRNLVNNLYKIMEDNNHKIKNAIKNKKIKRANEILEIVYGSKTPATCVPLYLEPTKIT